jgi:uncharacterized phage-associated protein
VGGFDLEVELLTCFRENRLIKQSFWSEEDVVLFQIRSRSHSHPLIIDEVLPIISEDTMRKKNPEEVVARNEHSATGEIYKSVPVVQFPMNKQKALAAAEYLLNKRGGKENYMKLLKLLFFADRYHVRTYLRPVTTDDYFAMPQGPVASYLYDVFKGQDPGESEIVRDEKDQYSVKLTKKEPDLSILSETDIEALEFSLKHFGKFNEMQLADIAHAYPEWKRFEAALNLGQTRREEIYLADFLKNADPKDPMFSKHHLKDPFPPIAEEEQTELREELLEIASQLA